MKSKYLSIFLSFTFILFSCNSVHGKEPIPENVLIEMTKTVMLYSVDVKNGDMVISASGIPITESLILTAGHYCDAVIKYSNKGEVSKFVSIRSLNKPDISQGIVYKYVFNEKLDICLVYKENHGLPIAKLAKALEIPKFGDVAYVVGAPTGIFPIITEGYVSVFSALKMPFEVLNGKMLLSTPITGGNSGGPVFNGVGEVIGIVVMGHATYPHIAFAVNHVDIWNFLWTGVLTN